MKNEKLNLAGNREIKNVKETEKKKHVNFHNEFVN